MPKQLPKSLTRRDALRLAAAAASSHYFCAPLLLGGCTRDDAGPTGDLKRRPLSAAYAGNDAAPIAPYDPARRWWMQSDFAPTQQEHDLFELEVVGVIPPELNGLYVRNGANPKQGDSAHWFLGHGMVHGVRLQSGKAIWYRNRFVRTPLLEDPNAGFSPFAPEASLASVSVVHHASRLLAAGEFGLPYLLSPDDLSTLGPHDFDGKLSDSFTAHPKIDPVTGEMFAFAYTYSPPFLRYYRIDPGGALISSEDIDLPLRRDGLGSKLCMMHDFVITQTNVVFLQLPVVFDLVAATTGFPFAWDETNGAHLGVMPRAGTSRDVTWIEIDPCFIFHTTNAYDDELGRVVFEAARILPPFWDRGNTGMLPAPVRLSRYTLDVGARSAKLEVLDDRNVDFPRVDDRMIGRKHRYVYANEFDLSKVYEGRVPRVVKYDLQERKASEHSFDPGLRPDEAMFVPAHARAGEDEGYLMTYVYDRRSDRSSLFILDASNLSAPPVAQVRLPVRVPLGAHGTWLPAG